VNAYAKKFDGDIKKGIATLALDMKNGK